MNENENIEETQDIESTEQVEQPQEEVVEQESPVSYKDDGTIVLDMDKLNELETANEQAQESVEATQETAAQVEVPEESVEQEVSDTVEEANQAIEVAEQTGQALPENIQKLVDFVNDTGGSVEDYVKLNRDYNEMDNQTALNEYYKITKPHLDDEERSFLMEDNFSFDEEIDEEREVRKKKIALKEQVAEAKAYLDGQKSKYYDEIKAGSNLTAEQQEAIQFFNQYNEDTVESERLARERSEQFTTKTNKVFNDEFKGFEYNVDGKKFRFNVKDPVKLKENQGDINNFIKKFLNKDNMIGDAQGYHKGLFTAMNPDQVANHFYEQGRADALKESIAKSKNVSMDPRQAHQENVNTSGFTARLLNSDGPGFKFKIKNKNK